MQRIFLIAILLSLTSISCDKSNETPNLEISTKIFIEGEETNEVIASKSASWLYKISAEAGISKITAYSNEEIIISINYQNLSTYTIYDDSKTLALPSGTFNELIGENVELKMIVTDLVNNSVLSRNTVTVVE